MESMQNEVWKFRMLILASAVLWSCGGGMAMGPRKVPPDSGPRSAEGPIVDGKRDGDWSIYYQGGKVEARGTYLRGRRVGVWTWWFEDGRKRAEGRYVDGKRQGRWQVWSEGGKVVSDEDFERGRRVASRLSRAPSDWRRRRCRLGAIAWRLKRSLPELRACVPAGVRGRLVARWVIDSDGQVSDIAIRSNTGNQDVEACVERVMWQGLFSRPARGRCIAERSPLLTAEGLPFT